MNGISNDQLVNLVSGSGTTGWCKKLHAGIGTDSWKKVFEQYDWLVARASFQRNAGLFAIAREGCLSGLQRGS